MVKQSGVSAGVQYCVGIKQEPGKLNDVWVACNADFEECYTHIMLLHMLVRQGYAPDQAQRTRLVTCLWFHRSTSLPPHPPLADVSLFVGWLRIWCLSWTMTFTTLQHTSWPHSTNVRAPSHNLPRRWVPFLLTPALVPEERLGPPPPPPTPPPLHKWVSFTLHSILP